MFCVFQARRKEIVLRFQKLVGGVTLTGYREQIMFDKNFVSSELPEIGAFSFSKDVMNEGDFAQISCIVTSGDQPLTISWSFHGLDGPNRLKSSPSGNNGITTTNLGSRMSMLVIEQVQHHHQGTYTCLAKNEAGTSSYTTELKVNGSLIS